MTTTPQDLTDNAKTYRQALADMEREGFDMKHVLQEDGESFVVAVAFGDRCDKEASRFAAYEANRITGWRANPTKWGGFRMERDSTRMDFGPWVVESMERSS
jgi:hypothetical protein